jgi:hypothetical protein
MNSLSKITTSKVLKDAYNDSLVAKRLINLCTDAGLRKDLRGLHGCPKDKLAEYVLAHLLESKVTDSDGSDFIKGKKVSEGKFATIAINVETSKPYTRKDGTIRTYVNESKKTKIGNLDSKDCDLHIMVCDPFDENHYFKMFSIPRDIWKAKWKGDSASLSFGKRGSWWRNYLVRTWSV